MENIIVGLLFLLMWYSWYSYCRWNKEAENDEKGLNKGTKIYIDRKTAQRWKNEH
jgi:hypothetical protein